MGKGTEISQVGHPPMHGNPWPGRAVGHTSMNWSFFFVPIRTCMDGSFSLASPTTGCYSKIVAVTITSTSTISFFLNACVSICGSGSGLTNCERFLIGFISLDKCLKLSWMLACSYWLFQMVVIRTTNCCKFRFSVDPDRKLNFLTLYYFLILEH